MNEYVDAELLDRFPQRIERAVVDARFQRRCQNLEPAQAQPNNRAAHFAGRERVMVGEADKPSGMSRYRASKRLVAKRLVATSRRESNPIDAVAVEFGNPATGDRRDRPPINSRLRLRFWLRKIPRQAPCRL